jgi:glyoxylase-like metal-dependent hydrolase (beta-lactamase superfamily II)
MIRETFPVGPLQCNCTILGDEASGEAMVVDPGDNIPQILSRLAHHNLTLKQIIVTHGHIDHIGGAARLKKATGAPIFLNQNDLPQLAIMDQQAAWLGVPTPEILPPDGSLEDGATIVRTPGHTEGSICLHFAPENLLLAGDTLFAGSIGRTDLPGGNSNQILRSLHDRLLTLPDETNVIPGHGPATTIGEERDSNPFLQPNVRF